MNLGTSGGFWIYAVLIGLGMAGIFGAILYFVARKKRSG